MCPESAKVSRISSQIELMKPVAHAEFRKYRCSQQLMPHLLHRRQMSLCIVLELKQGMQHGTKLQLNTFRLLRLHQHCKK